MKDIKIGNEVYFEAAEVVRELGISRQTLWKWRRQNHIPQGNRLRRNRLLFTPAEVPVILAFARRVEPADLATPTNQLKLTLK